MTCFLDSAWDFCSLSEQFLYSSAMRGGAENMLLFPNKSASDATIIKLWKSPRGVKQIWQHLISINLGPDPAFVLLMSTKGRQSSSSGRAENENNVPAQQWQAGMCWRCLGTSTPNRGNSRVLPWVQLRSAVTNRSPAQTWPSYTDAAFGSSSLKPWGFTLWLEQRSHIA